MERNDRINVAEKQRIRDTIADQVQRFLASGGNITVIDVPHSNSLSRRGSTWLSEDDLAPGLD